MQQIKGFIFDLDGTLAYTIGDLRTAMNDMLAQNGLPQLDEAGILRNINRGALEFVRQSLPAQYRGDEAFVLSRYAEYDAAYSRHFEETTCLYDGIAEALSKLRRAGKRLGVLSNKQHSHTAILCEKLLPAGTFDVVMGHLDLPHKPDPTAALAIAERFGLPAEEIAFVGDSDVDMKTAHNAGMYPVGVSWGYRDRACLADAGAALIVDDPAQIVTL